MILVRLLAVAALLYSSASYAGCGLVQSPFGEGDIGVQYDADGNPYLDVLAAGECEFGTPCSSLEDAIVTFTGNQHEDSNCSQTSGWSSGVSFNGNSLSIDTYGLCSGRFRITCAQ